MEVELDPASKRMRFMMLASREIPAEVSGIYCIALSGIWEKVERFEALGLLREVFSHVDAGGSLERYLKGLTPVDMSDYEQEIVLDS